ncbi:MAG TPA: DUF4349 domain-containing protein [Gaiellaceae bacterium]|nr:DUF4349 domain-containing protein [Gaiellaceae bacterium]
MSQRDLVAELRAAHLTAPPGLRERVRLISVEGQPAPRRITWRRALAVAVPVAAAVAATIVFTRPTHQANRDQALERLAPATVHGSAASVPAPTERAAKAFTVPTAPDRAQQVGATLGLRVATAGAVSDAVKRALAITASLGGYPLSVHAQSHGKTAAAMLTLKVPRTHVSEAITRLSALGSIRQEHVDVTDKQAGLNTTDRLIARLQRQLTTLRAQPTTATTTAQIAALVARIEQLQRGEAATRRATHYATIQLSVATPQPTVATHHGHGRLHGVVIALTWLGIGAVYALAIGVPVLLVLAAAWFAVRMVRRRREDALLG